VTFAYISGSFPEFAINNGHDTASRIGVCAHVIFCHEFRTGEIDFTSATRKNS